MTCGFQYPYSQHARHYLKDRMVCIECDDLPTQSDYLKNIVIPFEKRQISEQPVSHQGEPRADTWYYAEWNTAEWEG